MSLHLPELGLAVKPLGGDRVTFQPSTILLVKIVPKCNPHIILQDTFVNTFFLRSFREFHTLDEIHNEGDKGAGPECPCVEVDRTRVNS